MSIVRSDKKTAIVLFNLGGPDSQQAVRPFLFNLFKDPAIIRAPLPIRYAIAWLIAKRREPVAKEIYQKIGGSSPIVRQTREQAQALENYLMAYGQVKTFVSIRTRFYYSTSSLPSIFNINDRVFSTRLAKRSKKNSNGYSYLYVRMLPYSAGFYSCSCGND
jgi:protoheme ferro-lyase